MIYVFLTDEKKIIALHDNHETKTISCTGVIDENEFIKYVSKTIPIDTDWLQTNLLRKIVDKEYSICVHYWNINKKIDIQFRHYDSSSDRQAVKIYNWYVPNILTINIWHRGIFQSSFMAGYNQLDKTNLGLTALYPVCLPNIYPLSDSLGRICWGSSHPNLKNESYVEQSITTFFSSVFSCDVSVYNGNQIFDLFRSSSLNAYIQYMEDFSEQKMITHDSTFSLDEWVKRVKSKYVR